MKKVILLLGVILVTCLHINAQNMRDIIIKNNSACTAYYGLVLSGPQVYPNSDCSSTAFTSMLSIPSGASIRFSGLYGSSIFPPGITPPPAGQTYYFSKIRIYSSPFCSGTALDLGETCTGLLQSGNITFQDPTTCTTSCSNIPVSWNDVGGVRIEVDIN